MTEPTATHSLPADFYAMAAIPFDEVKFFIRVSKFKLLVSHNSQPFQPLDLWFHLHFQFTSLIFHYSFRIQLLAVQTTLQGLFAKTLKKEKLNQKEIRILSFHSFDFFITET